MTPTAEIGQYDLAPSFDRQLLDEQGRPVDVTGCQVQFHVRTPGCCARTLVSTARIVDARAGFVSHDWAAIETQAPGILEVWVLVIPLGGVDPRAFPTWGFWTVRVLPRLG